MATELVPIQKTGLTLYEVEDNLAALANTFEVAFLLSDSGQDLDKALQYARRASQLQPDSLAVSDPLGWVYLKKGMTDEAIGILRGVVQKDPQQTTYGYDLGVLWNR